MGGSLGVEVIGGRYLDTHGVNLTYKMITTIEEALEMLGIVVFVGALSSYIASRVGHGGLAEAASPGGRGLHFQIPVLVP